MELLYFFATLFRHWKKILIISILVGIGGAVAAKTVIQPTYQTTIFLSTVTKADNNEKDTFDPLSYVDAADRFAEAILGWFRNPTIFETILEDAPLAEGTNLAKIFKVRKQEKQNINISFEHPDEQASLQLKDATIAYLKERTAVISEDSNTQFGITSESYTIHYVVPSPLTYGGIGFVLAFIILTILFIFLELALGIVSFKEQVVQIIGKEPLDSMKKHESVSFLAHFVTQNSPLCIVAGVNVSFPMLAVKVANEIGEVLQRNVLLVDGDIENRALAEKVGLSKKLENMKGFTDKESASLKGMPLSKEHNNTSFIPAGTGTAPQLEVLNELTKKYDQIVLHSTLPANPYLFQITDAKLILLIQLGKTSIRDLRRIRNSSSNVEYVLIK